MFKKPFKIKSNTQAKGSEKKCFKELLLKKFPNLTYSDVLELVPRKEILNILKIVTHDEVVVQVYTLQKRPVIFDVQGRIFPSIFLLWRFPYLLYSFTTHKSVMNFLASGADLMLPGVITPPFKCVEKYGNVVENDIVYVNLSISKAAIAVGLAAQSSAAMARPNAKGKCVIIQHFQGDNLCTIEGGPLLAVPALGPPTWSKLKGYDEDFPELGSRRPNDSTDDSKEDSSDVTEFLEDEFNEEESDVPPDMNDLLHYCFLGALKYSKPTLPVLTSNFYKVHMLALCPKDYTMDVRKTSYKRLKPFLEKMAEDGIITMKEIKKGVESITEINQHHEKYTQFYIPPEFRPPKESADGDSAPTTDVVESYIITQNVLPIFETEGYQKGSNIQGLDIRKCVTKYVKKNNLQHEADRRLVRPREVLATICKTESPITWEEVMEKVCDSMKNCYKVKTGNEEILNKGKISPIMISVSVRSGNKKVTLVDNLEAFGLRLPEFAKECQHGVAASTSISRPPGKKYDQLLVQGNQVLFIYNLLTEKYKVPKKYVMGLESAPKKRK